MKNDQLKEELKLFKDVRENFLNLDPARFVKNNLTIDGMEFNIIDNGWRFMTDVYRYIAHQATLEGGKPVVIKKGRQVGATMMAGALDLYFTNSGLFQKPPIRVVHLFPALAQVKKFSQDKLEGMIRTSKSDFINKNKLNSVNAVDNLTMKQFKTGTLYVDSLGMDGDRIRGMTADVIFFDECFPYDQCILTKNGKMKIGKIHQLLLDKKEVPMVLSFNESLKIFEYKKVLNSWNKGKRKIIKIKAGKRKIECTPNHRFLTKRGWVEAKDLVSGDMMLSKTDGLQYTRSNSDDQEQIILGSFLGDGHIGKIKNKTYRLIVVHGEKQEEYCNFKSNMFDVNIKKIANNGFSKKPASRFSTKAFGFDIDIPEVKTFCPQEVLDRLDERGLAIWFMDDGSCIKKWNKNGSGALYTSSFDEDSQKRIVKKLKSMGINCKYKKYFHKNRDKEYCAIYFNKDGFESLSKKIAPYVHKSMEYKILDKHIASKYEWGSKNNEYGYTIVDEVFDINKEKEVFDIEVEDNHNFILTPRKSSANSGGPIAHNCQDMYAQGIGNATKILTASKYGPVGKGVQVYFGTPKEKSSYFSTIWDMSDQRYYHLGCESCEGTYPFYLSGDNRWEKIWLEKFTIQCPLCGHKQHKTKSIDLGKWVSSKPNGDYKFVGFHINQLYIPYFSKENILDLMPKNNPAQTDRIWHNEVIGEFYSGYGMPITKADIYQRCRDQDRTFARSIDPKLKTSYLGLDWGGKNDDKNSTGGQSYSCAVVLSAMPDGTLLIEHAHKLRKNTYSYKKETVFEMFRRFGVQRGVSDWFFGQDVVHDLQLRYGDKFLGAQGSGSLIKPLKFRADELIITYNKDLLIEEIFDLIRKGKIRFPWGSYEHLEWLIDHCTSMEVKQKVVAGNPLKTYVKGSGPNDGLMSLMYAYMAYKFDLTKGFSVKPGFEKKQQRPTATIAKIRF